MNINSESKELAVFIRAFASNLTELIEKNKPTIEKITEFLKFLDQHNIKSLGEIEEYFTESFFREFKDKYIPFVERTGWMISPNWSVEFIESMLDLDKQDTDDLLENFYMEENIETLFSDINNVLSKDTIKWNSLIQECMQAFRQGLFRPVIPAMISIVEGIIADHQNIKGTVNIEAFCMKQAELEMKNKNDIKRFNWILTNYYIANMFKTHGFEKERAVILNRHWVQHGRDNCNFWQKIDAISLFNTVYILLFLNFETD